MPSVLNATTTNGIAVTGDNSGALALQTNNGTTAVTIDTSQNVGIGTSSPEGLLSFSAAESNTPKIRWQNTVTGNDADAAISTFDDSSGTALYLGSNFYVDSNGNDSRFSTAQASSGIILARSGQINFLTNTSSGVATERMRITSDGTICMGTTNTDPSGNAVNGLAYVGSASALTANRSGNACVFLGRSTSTGSITIFRYNTADVGNIATNGSNCTYNSTSDYRLKENIAPMTGALSKVSQLKPVTYKWKKDGQDGQGFVAHELAEVCPEAVTGEKDAVDEEGKPVYQAIDQSVLVATLTAAIQELNAKVEAQAVRIAELEGAK